MEIDTIVKEINFWLEGYFKNKGTFNKKIYEAMSYSVNVGGKRIRPLLLIMTYNMYHKNYEEVLPVACAIEMIHTYSLIHDDLPCMDNDDMRRGKPTSHKVFGENIAVLAGDALLNEAMNVILSVSVNDRYVKAASVIFLSSGVEGMIGGQVVDVLGESKSNIPEEELLYMHRNKTGKLITAPILAGAILAGASKEECEKLSQYGEKLGLAFQIKDDILDSTGDEKKLGKKVKKDNAKNKTNFVNKYGIEKCNEMNKRLTNECIEILREIERDTSNLVSLTNFLLNRDY